LTSTASRPVGANITARTPPIGTKPLAARKTTTSTTGSSVANATTAATRARASTGSVAAATPATAGTTTSRFARSAQPNKPLPKDPAARALELKYAAELESKSAEINKLQTEKGEIEEKVRGVGCFYWRNGGR
jgi:hypothetical protein